MNPGLVTTQTQNVGQKSARFASANDFTSAAWRQMGTESSAAASFFALLLPSVLVAFFLPSDYGWMQAVLSKDQESDALCHTLHREGISPVYFLLKPCLFPKTAPTAHVEMIQNEFKCLFFFFHLSAIVVFRENKLLHMSMRRNKGVIWAVGQEHSTISITVCTGGARVLCRGRFVQLLSVSLCSSLCYITQRRAQGFCARCTNTRCSKAPGLVLCSGVHAWMNKEKIMRYQIPAFARKKAQKGVWLLCNTYLCFHKFYVFIKIW